MSHARHARDTCDTHTRQFVSQSCFGWCFCPFNNIKSILCKSAGYLTSHHIGTLFALCILYPEMVSAKTWLGGQCQSCITTLPDNTGTQLTVDRTALLARPDFRYRFQPPFGRRTLPEEPFQQPIHRVICYGRQTGTHSGKLPHHAGISE